MKIKVSKEFHDACPGFKGAGVIATVKNTPYSDGLWKQINQTISLYRAEYTTASIKDMPAIAASRLGYKACGKDPSRYRVSSEALCRRILRGLELYQIDTLVDLINLCSIRSGHSINGFDLDKIQGDELVLGIGKAGEPYQGIGKGELNIEGLPVYRDGLGANGSTTSDSNRTAITSSTTRLLATINAFDGNLQESVDDMVALLKEFAAAEDVEIIYY